MRQGPQDTWLLLIAMTAALFAEAQDLKARSRQDVLDNNVHSAVVNACSVLEAYDTVASVCSSRCLRLGRRDLTLHPYVLILQKFTTTPHANGDTRFALFECI